MKLRDEAGKVMLWLNRRKVAGDADMNIDPIHAGLPWAVIRLVLEARLLCCALDRTFSNQPLR